MTSTQTTRLLLVNPNISEAITDSFRAPVSRLNLPDTEISFWTNPSASGFAVLVTDGEIEESARQSLQPLFEIASEYDGFLMACFTRHPLFALLQSKVYPKPVVGMFEASVTTALHLIPPESKFSIVTTASSYIQHLIDSVRSVLGITTNEDSIFAGVVASGITWDVLTKEPKELQRG